MSSPAWRRRRRNVRVTAVLRRMGRTHGYDRRLLFDPTGGGEIGWLTSRRLRKVTRSMARLNHW